MANRLPKQTQWLELHAWLLCTAPTKSEGSLAEVDFGTQGHLRKLATGAPDSQHVEQLRAEPLPEVHPLPSRISQISTQRKPDANKGALPPRRSPALSALSG